MKDSVLQNNKEVEAWEKPSGGVIKRLLGDEVEGGAINPVRDMEELVLRSQKIIVCSGN